MDGIIGFLAAYLNTPVCVGAILVAWIIVLFFISFWRRKNKLQEKKRTIDQFPGVLSTLGVLGTFWGITAGLYGFNPSDLDGSIPPLLEGLKTAFYTSLAGMITSMLTNFRINKIYDNYEAGLPSNQDEAASRICEAVESMSKQNTETLGALLQSFAEQSKNQTTFYNTLLEKFNVFTITNENLTDISGKIAGLTLLLRSQDTYLKNIHTCMDQTKQLIDERTEKLSGSLSDLLDTSKEQLETLNGTSTIAQDTLDETKKFSEILGGEVDEIENKMGETNELLSQQFDEFAELLRKSNTEALVEVMREATREFQQQMNTVVNKLVKENFEQLNNSVERLNTWQQENKQMIQDLTRQYADMTKEFERTSTILDSVAEHTRQLSDSSGMLARLIKELQKVMINDTKFTSITNKLSETVDLTKNNMQKFDESTVKLNEWVKKQRNFVDGVQLLIKKLDELSSIRDYNKEFWADTKKHMEEGVGIIRKGSESLNAQLTDLDKQFYSRLSATLAELDACIEAMIKGR